ncbi:hydroxyacid dehydrogenase [Vulcanisaeta distributa]|uniref:D-isomer specific 2-hydroxyacid dehydrogenase NAD-binding protein n=1 Tax=Vulcanisaeta distributa (strain DSM 14429 / JCM 11212 / NBRC 100878 / IC-017) TaxID=572478 RepID=E1QT77_VULDI|nr:hydroxyacid dehydrogenase [Vulcanisaeta distributa]ADN49669.1 D-isomer specific 2-hydroxyacid dehydrogenase NAD-binding protein [Vulcanisaeta distributa DSM 14429]
MRILVTIPLTDPDVGPQAMKMLSEVGEVDIKPMTTEQLKDAIRDYDAVIVSVWHRVTKDVIDAGRNLKVIGTASVGTDHIDVEYAEGRGIKVVSAAGASTYSVAEFTFGLLLMMVKRIPENMGRVRNGEWSSLLTPGIELFGKTLGIIGFGRIGSYVASIANAFRMRVLAYDPFVDRERFIEVNAIRVDNLDDLLKQSDFITIHTSLTRESRGLIGRREVGLMKDGVYIINTARGEVVDENAILEGLKSGKIAGYAADVLTGEPPTEDTSPLLRAFRRGEVSNLFITSHIAGVTRESVKRYTLYVAKGVRDALIAFKR